MKRTRLLGFSFWLSLILSTGTLSAALLEVDHPVFGIKSLTVDTDTQLAWLDLTCSLNYSFLQAEAATQPGGLFQGFRHASSDEIAGLFNHAGLVNHMLYADPSLVVSSFVALVGATSFDGEPETFGISGSPAADGSRWVGGVDFFSGNGVGLYNVSADVVAYGETTAFPTVGNWLVMAVPEPTSAALCVGGVVPMLFPRWRRILDRSPDF